MSNLHLEDIENSKNYMEDNYLLYLSEIENLKLKNYENNEWLKSKLLCEVHRFNELIDFLDFDFDIEDLTEEEIKEIKNGKKISTYIGRKEYEFELEECNDFIEEFGELILINKIICKPDFKLYKYDKIIMPRLHKGYEDDKIDEMIKTW